ncbi:MAG: hypothetical protein Q8R86_10665 [Sulfuricurvum sp.]|nr:hypothetical protein [Sulfuricurvum sp.]
MRHAFGLPQVLLIILFIGGIVTVTIRYASLGAKHYADSYTREQAELFMQSATEAALLQISGNSRLSASECRNEFQIISSDQRFKAEINVTAYYLFEGKDNNGLPWNCDRNVSIETPESHGMIDMTVLVESNNSNPRILHPVRLERRSLQRP